MVETRYQSAVGGAVRARFDDGRWHFQQGPIDLIIFVDGSPQACEQALESAWGRFVSVLVELTAELPLLRSDGAQSHQFVSPIARRMASACWPFHQQFGLFITPMAAVAGSVAEEMLACMKLPGIRRASVNNGGDIALFVNDGARFKIGVIADIAEREVALPSGIAPSGIAPGGIAPGGIAPGGIAPGGIAPGGMAPPGMPPITATLEIDGRSGVGGIATSGWRGRSLSLGIADAVTVLARTAAEADAAATMIANAINVEHPGIVRLPANQVRDDSDLLGLLVTRGVAALPQACIDQALDRGLVFANQLVQARLVESAFLALQGNHRIAGDVRRGLPPSAICAKPEANKEETLWQLKSENSK